MVCYYVLVAPDVVTLICNTWGTKRWYACSNWNNGPLVEGRCLLPAPHALVALMLTDDCLIFSSMWLAGILQTVVDRCIFLSLPTRLFAFTPDTLAHCCFHFVEA